MSDCQEEGLLKHACGQGDWLYTRGESQGTYIRAMNKNMEWQLSLKRVVYSEDLQRSASSVVCQLSALQGNDRILYNSD